MWPWTRRELTPVGLEIDGTGVRLVQVRFRAGDRPAVRVSHRLVPTCQPSHDPLAPVRAAARAARRLLSDGGFSGRRVVTCLPDQLVHLKTLRLPPGCSKNLDQSVRREARVLFPFDIEAARLQHIEAGQTRYGTDVREEVIVAASVKREVDAFLLELNRAGLDVVALDLAPCAAYHAAQWGSAETREVHAVLHVGETSSHVAVGRGDSIRFLKRVSIGTEHLNSEVSRRLGIDTHDAAQVRRRVASAVAPPPGDRDTIRRPVWQACRSTLEALAGEVSICLRYYGVAFRGRRPECLLLSGPESGNQQLRSILSSAVSMPTDAVRPFASFELAAGVCLEGGEPAGEWGVAAGLALKAAARPAQLIPAPTNAIACDVQGTSAAPAFPSPSV